MTSTNLVAPSRAFRDRLVERGGGTAARCFQCATCSGVCDLSDGVPLFPRRQLLWAQWGLVDRLAADPAVWLCHQCNDCSVRCPRDARPGDAMQAIRAILIEEAGSPRAVARLVARARTTWPVLLGAPVLFWALLISAVNGFSLPQGPLVYGDVVPHWLVDAVFVPAALFAAVAAARGARRAWRAWGGSGERSGNLVEGLVAAAKDILAHRRFETCGAAKPRRDGHLLLVSGFAGGLLTTSLVAVGQYGFGLALPLPQHHPIKLLGNASAVLMAVGVVLLAVNRLADEKRAGRSSPFDRFFLALVATVVFSGIGAQLGRYLLPAPLALAVYVLHLGAILSLFLTFPFSKFAHALYRTLAMVHERLTNPRRGP